MILDKLNGYNFLDDILKSHDTPEIAEFKCIMISKPNDAVIVPSSDAMGMLKATEISHFFLQLPGSRENRRNGRPYMYIGIHLELALWQSNGI